MKSTPCQQLIKVIDALCDDVATPKAKLVKALVKKGEWAELQKLRVKPSDYTNSEQYFLDCSVVDLLRKADIESGIDTKAAAVETFWKCETQNAKTNARLQRYLPDLLVEDPEDGAMVEFIQSWRKEIAYVLKGLPNDLTPKFGGGSTYGDKGMLTTLPDKLSGPPSVTPEAWTVVHRMWTGTAWERFHNEALYGHWGPEFVRGNRFATVPKTGQTDRGICIEPSLNVGYQLALGGVIRDRLRIIGIDLRKGQDVHRERALYASFMDTDATIDLSNASDTICRILPQLVLPSDWFELLNSLRSGYTEIDGKVVRLEKFSSMGNGFTFETETLLFVTLARCVVRRLGGDVTRVLCYGDDLIVPKGSASTLKSALEFFGFSVNQEKSFFTGPFRESCGGDFWKGVPVRAHFLKELPYEPQHWIGLANGLYRMGHSDPGSNHRWDYFRRAHRLCLDNLPSRIRRLTGPAWLGDLVIRDDDPSAWPTFVKNFGTKENPSFVRGVRTYAPVSVPLSWDHWKPGVQLASALCGLLSAGVSPRDSISGYRESFAVLYRNDWLPEVRLIR